MIIFVAFFWTPSSLSTSWRRYEIYGLCIKQCQYNKEWIAQLIVVNNSKYQQMNTNMKINHWQPSKKILALMSTLDNKIVYTGTVLYYNVYKSYTVTVKKIAERPSSWKTRRRHTCWIMWMLSCCMQWSLSPDTTVLCWSLFLVDVFKISFPKTRCCITAKYVVFIFYFPKSSSLP